MKNRSSFPRVFWIANSIEILERIAYYGIYMGFGVYMDYLGFTRDQLGWVQSLFLFISYFIPVFSGTFADKYGFKKVLIVAYLAYIPSILLLLITKSFSGIALTMLSIGFAAGIFKPLISGTVRLTTDATNKTLGFGIFYTMVNVGGTIGPILAAKLRVISWNYAFAMAAFSIVVMLLVTIFFYKEPEKEQTEETIGRKLLKIFSTLTDIRFAALLIVLGVFFWWPFWAFFNLSPVYIDKHIDTIRLFHGIEKIFGSGFAHLLSRNESGVWRVNGESIANTGWIILLFQLVVSRIFEKRRAMPSFMLGMLIAAIGFSLIGYAIYDAPGLMILGIFVFGIGEMITSPRIQEYITWIAPKEKAGLYMGSNFLAVCIGAFLSGRYTSWLGHFETTGHADYVWYLLAAHCLVGILAVFIFIKTAGEFKEMQA
jgi:proton-dependent oligopeptide transporter, POT family